MKTELNKFSYKLILLKNADPNNTIDLTKYLKSHKSQQGVELENDTFSLDFNLEYTYKNVLGEEILAHQFVKSDGTLDLTADDIIRVFVKQGGDEINTNSRDDLLAEYFVKDYNLDTSNKKITINFVNINYKIYNRLWSGSYGIVDSGTLTSTTTLSITDSSKSWETNQYYLKTLELIDVNNKTYNYLIMSNTSDTLTLNKEIDSGLLSTYKIGDSSPSVIYEALKRVTPTESFNGKYELEIIPSFNSSSKGIAFVRTDGYAYPIIDYSQNRKAYYKLISELSSSNATNTEYELNTQDKLYVRDNVFTVSYNTELDKYTIDWYYPISANLLTQKAVISISTNIITTTSGMTIDEYKGLSLRINNRTFNILSNTSNTITVSGDLTNIAQSSDLFNIYEGVDFIWDSYEDFKNIYSAKFTNSSEGNYNHIYFSAGTNKINNREIIGHRLKEDFKGSLVETYIPMTYIAKTVLNGDDRLQSDGSYAYPDYTGGYYIHNSKGENYIWSEEVNSNAEYNANFKTICRNIAYRNCDAIFKNIKQGTMSAEFTLIGNKYFTAGDTTDLSKVYNKGTQILFKNPMNGIVNKDQINGYYIFKVDDIKHTIDNTGWTTTLTVSYDLYKTAELSGILV